MRLIGLFKAVDLTTRRLYGKGGNSVIEVMKLGRTYDRGGDRRIAKHPGERDLRSRQFALLGDLGQTVDDGLVDRCRPFEQPSREGVGFRTLGRRLVGPRARQAPTRERRLRIGSHPFGQTERQHLPLLLAVEKVV